MAAEHRFLEVYIWGLKGWSSKYEPFVGPHLAILSSWVRPQTRRVAKLRRQEHVTRYGAQNQADDRKIRRDLFLHRRQCSKFISSLIIIPWTRDKSSKTGVARYVTRQQALLTTWLRQGPALKCSPKCKGERLPASPNPFKYGPAVHTVIRLRYFYPFPDTTAFLCFISGPIIHQTWQAINQTVKMKCKKAENIYQTSDFPNSSHFNS